MSAKFEEHFWGEGNHGFEVLMQNLKAGVSASKELGEFIRERAAVEDAYVKGLSKLHKMVLHVPDSTLGAFSPMWQVLKQMCEELSTIHSQFVQLLTELSREIGEYNTTQKDKLKTTLKGEIELAQDSLQAFESCDATLHKTKKLYQQSCDHVTKLQGKLEKTKTDPNANPKAKQQVEHRLNQSENWMETMKTDHQAAVQRHCDHLMEFQGKFVEAALKFESVEEEHLAQMVTFMIKMSQAQDNSHVRVERVYSAINEQLNSLSVEKLLNDFVDAKGTGKEKPRPYKFRKVATEAPAVSVTSSVSQDDLRPPSPSTGIRTTSKGEKSFRHRFKKKLGISSKAATVDAGANGPVPTVPTPEEAETAPDVDDEGYSIRPEDAAKISHFPDDQGDSDSDSDFEDQEKEPNIKNIHIKQTSDVSSATVDDIKASVMTLRLGSPSPSSGMIRKATSSQSLNILTSPTESHRRPSAESADNTAVSSLLDLDITNSTMPAPLLPMATYNPDILLGPLPQPTESLVPWNIPSVRASSTPPLLPTPITPSTMSNEESPPGPRPIPRPRTSSSLSPEAPRRGKMTTPPGLPPPVPSKRRTATNLSIVDETSPQMDTDVTQGSRSAGSSPRLEQKNDITLTPPVPAPRRASSWRQMSNPEQPPPVSPLATNQLSAQTASNGIPSVQQVGRTQSPQNVGGSVIPIAVAFQETCNAIFKGTDVSQCVAKVTGEIVMSFPANFVGHLNSHDTLQFKLSDTDNVERVLHNQHLLKREGESFSYKFEMQALSSHLKQLAERHLSPFYNLHVLKYEVNVSDGKKLPLQLVCYWKCEPTITNVRLDYTYTPSAFTLSPKPTLTNMVVSVPVNGGVKNALSKPSGVWTAEQNKLVWKVGELQPTEQPSSRSLHGKFEVTSGPSIPAPAVFQFSCDGGSLSGVVMELGTPAYRISLLKNKCIAGKYVVEPING